MRRLRLCYFNTWVRGLEDAVAYAHRAAEIDLAPLVANPSDPALLQKARLDCDWYAENARCFGALRHDSLEFLPAWVCGADGLLELTSRRPEAGEERWLLTMGQQPQALRDAGKIFGLLAKMKVRHLFYAFDAASYTMPCFNDIAPHLSVLIHDDFPLAPTGHARLPAVCRVVRRSWVANVVPFSAPFNEVPEEKIFFLGSQLGLTAQRQRQLEFLSRTFQDRFFAIHDHSLPMRERDALRRFKASVCPEGRHFAVRHMSRSHTDRPFWVGCLGMVPVAENSKAGDRLEELAVAGLIVRYRHGDLKSLGEACERALALGHDERRRIYDHFNRHETIGTVVAEALATAG